jgi:hypothetical protein
MVPFRFSVNGLALPIFDHSQALRPSVGQVKESTVLPLTR